MAERRCAGGDVGGAAAASSRDVGVGVGSDVDGAVEANDDVLHEVAEGSEHQVRFSRRRRHRGSDAGRAITSPSAVDDGHHSAGEPGIGHLDHRVVDVVVLEPQRLAHRGVHRIGAGDVGELEDLLVGEVLLQLGEQRVGHPARLQHEAVGVGEHRSLDRAPAVGDRPCRDRGDLFVGEADVAHRLAVLTEDELAADGEPGPRSGRARGAGALMWRPGSR